MKSIGYAIAVLAGLAFVFRILLMAADKFPGSFAQLTLVSLGSAIFGSGLTFSLIHATRVDEGK